MDNFMKAVIIAAMLLSSAGSCNAQTIPTTPNLGLQLIPDGYQNWGVPYRTTMNTIDSKVAPLASPHFTGTATAVNLTVTGTCTGCGSGSGAVSSVFGRTGAIAAQSGDYNFSQVAGQMNFATQGTGLVPIANGGTGTSSPGLVQGTNITITGTWPNQTINATASAQVYPAAGVAVSTGSAWGSSLTAPSGALVGTTDTQTLTNKTVNGVTPTTFGFLDPTSSVQTQLNAKQATLTLTTTGTSGAATLSSGTLNIPQYTYTLPQATTSVLGGVKCDGTTITCTAGVITATTSGTGTVTHTAGALTAGQMVIGNGAADVKVDTGCSTDGAGNQTCTSYSANGSGPSQFTATYNATPLVPGSSTTAVYGVNASGQAVVSEAAGAASRLCTAANGVCAAAGVTFPWSCQPGLGDGLNSITAGTYLQTSCYNDTGQTVTLTGIKCYTDAGTPTMNVTNGAGTGLLTGAITCTTSFAAGTQSGTTTLAAGDYLKFTFVASGTAKQSTFVVTGTHP